MESTGGEAPEDPRSAEVHKRLEHCRRELLDLALSNPLLNYKMKDAAGARYIRAVDEQPEFLYRRLGEGKSMLFRAVPMPRASLPPTQDGERESRASRKEAARAAAVAANILTDFELPAPATGGQENPAHADEFVQTLVFEDAMEHSLRTIKRTAQSSLDERGVNTLCAAFGFLEWYEDEKSELPLLAPLILQEVEIRSPLLRGRRAFELAALDTDPHVNVPLAERLRRDFHIVLPEIGEDEGPEAYFRRVLEALPERERTRWRVRRFVTVGIFDFARLVMYRDLQATNWQRRPGESFGSHAVVASLLGGETQFETEVRFDSSGEITPDEVERMAPTLVERADSSQTAAIVDVMKGTSLVIKGPPGTGKSQTITNLIATAMGAGKRVLFVAEKKAALDVVKARLDHVGLGEFCLELHSTKANKKDLFDALHKRLAARDAYAWPLKLDERAADLKSTVAALNAYSAGLEGNVEAADENLYTVLGRAVRSVAAFSEAPTDLKRIDFRTWSAERVRAVRSAVERVEACWRAAGPSAEDCWRRPWTWFVAAELTPARADELQQILRRYLTVAQQLADYVATVSSLHAVTLEALEALSKRLAGLPTQRVAEASLMSAFAREGSIAAAEAYVAASTERDASSAELATIFRTLPEREAVNAIVTKARNALAASDLAAVRVGDIESVAAEAERRRHSFDTAAACVEAAAKLVGVDGSCADALLSAVRILRRSSRDTLVGRRPGLVAAENLATLSRLAEQARLVAEEHNALSTTLVVHPGLDSNALREAAAGLRSASWFSWMSGTFRRQRALARSLTKDPATKPTATVADLDALATHVEARTSLGAEPLVREHLSATALTSLAGVPHLLKVATWAEEVRRILRGTDPGTRRVREFLFTAALDDLESLQALADPRVSPEFLEETTRLTSSTGTDFNELLHRSHRDVAAIAELKAASAAFAMPADVVLGKIERGVALLEQIDGCDARLRKAVHEHEFLQALSSSAGEGVASIALALEAVRLIDRCALPDELRTALLSPSYPHVLERTNQLGIDLRRTFAELSELRQRATSNGLSAGAFNDPPLGAERCDTFIVRATHLQRCVNHATYWTEYQRSRVTLARAGGEEVLQAFESALRPMDRMREWFDACLYQWLAKRGADELSAATDSRSIQDHRERYRAFDDQVRELQRAQLRAKLCRNSFDKGVASGNVRSYTGAALIAHEAQKKARHIPIRELMRRAGTAIQALKPCFLMSPMSVAQFLPPLDVEFDLLVIDEASQMRPEDAIGAVRRATQIAIVGDPQQLPPSAFFTKSSDDDDSDDPGDATDVDSILDLTLQRYRSRELSWHYRSKHPRLIAFSNAEFYEGGLHLFPPPPGTHVTGGVFFHSVEGSYAAGTNEAEADRLVEAALQFMARNASGGASDRSLGIVAMNIKQSELINDKLERIEDTPLGAPLRKYRERWASTLESLFVKNLENVQGDERDVIYVSFTYGKEPGAPRVAQRFGPINSDGGHRRLNVLFTRAKHELHAFSSMQPSDVIVGDNDTRRGVRVLRSYLEYASSDASMPQTTARNIGGDVDSEFEEEVRVFLAGAGFQVETQREVKGYFVDLCVREANPPHRIICGVECDGARYHSTRAARDRDILREEILESQGWKIVRVWSTDWFRSPARAKERLLADIERARGVSQ